MLFMYIFLLVFLCFPCKTLSMDAPELQEFKNRYPKEVIRYKDSCATLSNGLIYHYDQNNKEWYSIGSTQYSVDKHTKKRKLADRDLQRSYCAAYDSNNQLLVYANIDDCGYPNIYFSRNSKILKSNAYYHFPWSSIGRKNTKVSNLLLNNDKSYCACVFQGWGERNCGATNMQHLIITFRMPEFVTNQPVEQERLIGIRTTVDAGFTRTVIDEIESYNPHIYISDKDDFFLYNSTDYEECKVNFKKNNILEVEVLPYGVWEVNTKTNKIIKSECVLNWHNGITPMKEIYLQVPQGEPRKSLAEQFNRITASNNIDKLIYNLWIIKQLQSQGMVPDICSTIATKTLAVHDPFRVHYVLKSRDVAVGAYIEASGIVPQNTTIATNEYNQDVSTFLNAPDTSNYTIDSYPQDQALASDSMPNCSSSNYLFPENYLDLPQIDIPSQHKTNLYDDYDPITATKNKRNLCVLLSGLTVGGLSALGMYKANIKDPKIYGGAIATGFAVGASAGYSYANYKWPSLEAVPLESMPNPSKTQPTTLNVREQILKSSIL